MANTAVLKASTEKAWMSSMCRYIRAANCSSGGPNDHLCSRCQRLKLAAENLCPWRIPTLATQVVSPAHCSTSRRMLSLPLALARKVSSCFMDMGNLKRVSPPLTKPDGNIRIHRFFFPSTPARAAGLTSGITSAHLDADCAAVKEQEPAAKVLVAATPGTEP